MSASGSIILVMIMLLPALPAGTADHPVELGMAFTTPIVIDGDEEFAKSSAVRAGDGSPSNPYEISSWIIAGPGEAAITIRNTSAHLTIRDNEIQSAITMELWNAGIWLENAQNVTIVETTINHALHGIFLQKSGNIAIKQNSLNGAQFPGASSLLVWSAAGIVVRDSNDVAISSNNIENHASGIHLSGTGTGYLIDDNTLERLIFSSGISVQDNVENVNIFNNTIHRAPTGMSITGGINITLQSNDVQRTSLGLHVQRSGELRNVITQGNSISNGYVGIRSASCEGCEIKQNLITANEVGALLSTQGSAFTANCLSGNDLAIEPSADANVSGNLIPDDNLLLVRARSVNVHATDNWWGDADGPAKSKIIEEDGGTVNINPWLIGPPDYSGPPHLSCS